MPKIHASGMVTDVNVVAVSGVTEERVIAVSEAVEPDIRPRRKAGATSPGTSSSTSSPTSKTKPTTNATEPPRRARTTGNP